MGMARIAGEVQAHTQAWQKMMSDNKTVHGHAILAVHKADTAATSNSV